MLTYTKNYDHQDGSAADGAALSFGQPGGYDVFAGCRHYSPAGGAVVMNMEDYTMCDACRHRRMDGRCGVAEKTLM